MKFTSEEHCDYAGIVSVYNQILVMNQTRNQLVKPFQDKRLLAEIAQTLDLSRLAQEACQFSTILAISQILLFPETIFGERRTEPCQTRLCRACGDFQQEDFQTQRHRDHAF